MYLFSWWNEHILNHISYMKREQFKKHFTVSDPRSVPPPLCAFSQPNYRSPVHTSTSVWGSGTLPACLSFPCRSCRCSWPCPHLASSGPSANPRGAAGQLLHSPSRSGLAEPASSLAFSHFSEIVQGGQITLRQISAKASSKTRNKSNFLLFYQP